MARFEQRMNIDAAVEQVWGILTNPATWAQWFPDVERVTGLNAIQAGATFQWQSGDDTGSGSIEVVDENRGLIKVVTNADGKPTIHIFDLDRSGGFLGLGGGDTRLTYHREYDTPGGFIGEFVTGGNPVDLLKVKQTLEKVKRLAEG